MEKGAKLMSKKIDERLPKAIGEGVMPGYAAIKSPWEKLVCYRDAMHYASRYNAVVGAAIMQAYRILIPDYVERSQLMCEEAYQRLSMMQKNPSYGGKVSLEAYNVHPFCRGSFVGGLNGDNGDEALLMCGRVNDFGTYRVEKELDVCDWDIVGSELCRATTMSLQAGAEGMAAHLRPGTSLEYCMVEAKGCGDRHCRIVAESRDKYPMPEHKLWESFGPIATADLIKNTPEAECVKESMVFREECNYTFTNGTNVEKDSSSTTLVALSSSGTFYLLPAIGYIIKKGLLDEKTVDHVLKCVCEAAGKAAFGEASSRAAQRQWLGVPAEIRDDGRVMGGHIEMYLQSLCVQYEIEAFNNDEVIYVIDRGKLTCGQSKFADCLVSYWYGMTKTLVNAQWFLWEEAEDVPENKLRIKIAKKIDKFC